MFSVVADPVQDVGAQGMSLRHARMFKIAAFVACHADSSHHALRTQVKRGGKGHDFRETDGLECKEERRRTSLAGIAHAPMGSRQSPSHLDRRGERHLVWHPMETDEPEERLGGN